MIQYALFENFHSILRSIFEVTGYDTEMNSLTSTTVTAIETLMLTWNQKFVTTLEKSKDHRSE